MGARERLKKLYLKYTELRWTVGVAEYDEDTILTPGRNLKIHWVKYASRDSWFADPFILSVTPDHVILLVEELLYSNNKGRISKLTVNRHTWRLESVEPVIDIATHLSFPAYFRMDEKVYIYPESTKSGKLTLYVYDEQSGEVHPVKDLCKFPVADAVIYDLAGKKYLFATTSPHDNGRTLDIYTLEGEESAPGKDSVRHMAFPTCVARNAGFPFEIGGKWYRPAQDCSKSYGRCTVIQEMNIEDGMPFFTETRRFFSRKFNYWEAFHTFNVFDKQYVAVDAEGLRHGLLATVVYRVRNLLR